MQTPRTWPTKIPTQKNSEIEKSAYATAVAMLIRQGFRRSKDILSAQIFGLYREGPKLAMRFLTQARILGRVTLENPPRKKSADLLAL